MVLEVLNIDDHEDAEDFIEVRPVTLENNDFQNFEIQNNECNRSMTELEENNNKNDKCVTDKHIRDENNEEQEQNVQNEKCRENKNKITRKPKRNTEKWKQNIRKEKRQHGCEYINTKGKVQSRKFVKEFTCRTNKCKFKCTTKIISEEREAINKKFWSLNDDKKNHFYSKHVKRQVAARKRTLSENSRKTYSYEYFLYVSGVKIRVCQEFFFNTLNISKNRIYYFFKHVQDSKTNIARSPLTGKHKKKIIPEEMKERVRGHIASFPVIDSHYCRQNSTRKYLERNLSIQRMYDMYKSSEENPVRFHLYKKIFNTEFNISFFKPKKDLCDKCEGFKLNKNPTEEQLFAQEEHIKRKNVGSQERARDRIAYSEVEKVGVLTFDLQNTFSLPKSNVSNFYYKTKLSCYNLTAHFSKTKVVYNAIWHEMICGRGGNHIACALIKILRNVVNDNPEVEKIILWSDSCVPQNKNSVMSFALQHFLNSGESQNLKVIEQKFGEPGHGNVQEIDSAHSCIEKYLRNVDIWSPFTLIRLMLNIPNTWKLKFKVLQMMSTDYKNYQLISETLSYNKIPYTRVKHVVYEKNCIFNVKFTEAFESEFEVIKLENAKKNRKKEQILKFPEEIPVMNLAAKISDLKQKHLKEMLPYIPENERDFYKVILKIGDTENSVKRKQSTEKKSKKKVKN